MKGFRGVSGDRYVPRAQESVYRERCAVPAARPSCGTARSLSPFPVCLSLASSTVERTALAHYMATPSPAARLEASFSTLERLAAKSLRQLEQIDLEQRGVRKQGRPRSPRGSRPYLREKASKAKEKAEARAVAEAAAAALAATAATFAAARCAEADRIEPKRVAAERVASERAEVERLAAVDVQAEARRAAEDPSTSRGQWATAENAVVAAFLSSGRRVVPNDASSFYDQAETCSFEAGSWAMAQRLAQLNSRWRARCLEWCASVSSVWLCAPCWWGSGVLLAVMRTSPRMTGLHLHGFDAKALAELNCIGTGIQDLTLSRCGGVGAALQSATLPLLKTLQLVGCRDVTSDALRRTASESAMLVSLRLIECRAADGVTLSSCALAFPRNLPPNAGALRCLYCDAPLADEVVRAFMRACPQLEELTLHYVTSAVAVKQAAVLVPCLWRLELYAATGGTPSFASWNEQELQGLAQTHRLTHLRLENGRDSPVTGAFLPFLQGIVDLSLAGLQTALLADSIAAFAHAAGPSLRRLDLSGCNISQNASAAVECLLRCCHALEHLELADAGLEIRNNAFDGATCTKLRYLGLGGCSSIVSKSVALAMIACPHLEVLDVSRTDIDDEALQAIAEHALMLSHLDLSCCSCITSAGVNALLSKRMKLSVSLPPRTPTDLDGSPSLAQR